MNDLVFTDAEVFAYIEALADYAIGKALTAPDDRIYVINGLCAAMGIIACGSGEKVTGQTLPEILGVLCDAAVRKGLCGEGIAARDRFDTMLMGILTPRPSEVIAAFRAACAVLPRKATDGFYRLAVDSNYIRADRIARDRRWTTPSKYGDIDISINLSKPEKDPRDIAAAKNAPQTDYPKCLLCRENVGYPGDAQKPARQNLRQIPLTLGGAEWFMQYSPYVYYNEHCIVLSGEHYPMSIRHETFVRMLDFVELLPHYFIGSNADLPIVGGSILSHDHMQGGCYEFPMARAGIIVPVTFSDYPSVTAGIVDWPMSVLRLRSADKSALVSLADRILAAWRGYSDPAAGVFAETDGVPHNTVTPIARRRGGDFELDLVVRNNITSEEHPLGVFHPHAERHNIKKENIGLIEVMGLAILPARLLGELDRLGELILAGADDKAVRADEKCSKHADWLAAFRGKYDFTPENTEEILQREVGNTFVQVLEDAGVYKADAEGRDAFMRFINTVIG